MECRVCETKCVVKRDSYGPTCFAAAMGGSKRKHDCFWCPYHEAEWHEQALKLVQEKGRTSSKRIAALIEQDLADIFKKHLPGYDKHIFILGEEYDD
jgi:hypothetical protein